MQQIFSMDINQFKVEMWKCVDICQHTSLKKWNSYKWYYFDNLISYFDNFNEYKKTKENILIKEIKSSRNN